MPKDCFVARNRQNKASRCCAPRYDCATKQQAVHPLGNWSLPVSYFHLDLNATHCCIIPI